MIVFVLCPAFHGATLLSLLLNNHSQILAFGDTNPVRAYDQVCTCGEKISTCAFWNSLIRENKMANNHGQSYIFPSLPEIVRNERLNKALNTFFALVANAFSAPWIWKLIGRSAENFRQSYSDFLKACRDWVPHAIFIDGEKNLLKYIVVKSMGFPVAGVIHVLRDPRGYARSYAQDVAPRPYRWIGRDWRRQHRLIRIFSRLFSGKKRISVKYETLATQPEETMRQIFDFLNLELEQVICKPRFPNKHHMVGNIMLSNFNGTISDKMTWKEELSMDAQKDVLSAAGSISGNAGYSF